jgi:hypothetical protein
MTKKNAARLVTALVMAGLAVMVVVRHSSVGVQPQKAEGATPQTTIYTMLDAARSGDIAAYLDEYTGSLQASLKQTIDEKTEAAFARYLRASDSEIKGVAVSEPRPLSDREVAVKVEYVYQDRNEAQTLVLEKAGERWKITRVDDATRVKTPVPYGSKVE